MKLHVAYRLRVVLSLLSVAMLFVSIISAQTTRRNTGKRSTNDVAGRAANTSRDGTLIICQGLPVPRGYAIIAYLTSTACPHGAYVLKKQDPFSESVAARYARRNQSTNATNSRNTEVPDSNSSDVPQTSSPATTSPAVTDSVDPFLNAPLRNGPAAQPVAQPVASASPSSISAASAGSAEPGSRPRRVAVASSPNDVAITEDQPERPARPPQWTGTPPTTSPSAASAATLIDPGPEEVSEGDVLRVN
ncbi:MAG TPA: hypothetical protein VGW76_21440, partial [Pyrinomonadaceae bacterium]|nr:hypothetical protein [Pyrinomonadaceae bacterium]